MSPAAPAPALNPEFDEKRKKVSNLSVPGALLSTPPRRSWALPDRTWGALLDAHVHALGCFWALLSTSGAFWALLSAPRCSLALLLAPGRSWGAPGPPKAVMILRRYCVLLGVWGAPWALLHAPGRYRALSLGRSCALVGGVVGPGGDPERSWCTFLRRSIVRSWALLRQFWALIGP